METFNLEHYLQAPHKCVIINRGLPASGKSTWTAEMLANTPGFTSVSKDDLRKGLGNWTPKKERTVVLPTRDKIITTNLELGFSVIVDDTNFESKHLTRIEEIANSFNVPCYLNYFEIGLHEAIARDKSRGQKAVGERVIRQMWQRYIRPTKAVNQDQTAPVAVLCDIDGTLAHMQGRNAYDWARVGEDTLDLHVFELLYLYRTQGYKIILMSGRDGVARKDTVDWLTKHHVHYDALFMRIAGDKRPDNIVKQELWIENVLPYYFTSIVLDDRQQVVDMWRDLGLKVFQVADGDF